MEGCTLVLVHHQARARLAISNALRQQADCAIVGATDAVDKAADMALERGATHLVVIGDSCGDCEALTIGEVALIHLGEPAQTEVLRDWAVETLLARVRRTPSLSAGTPTPRPSQAREVQEVREDVPVLAIAQSGQLAPVPPPRKKRPTLIAIASSTGGPDALAALLSCLPEDLAVPVVLVQHMGAQFTDGLAERLDRHCRLKVQVASAGSRPRAGEVWLAPGGKHMVVRHDPAGFSLHLNEEPHVHGCRPAADVTFRALVDSAPGRVLAVVLTGMGEDGARGARALAETGCRVIAQDKQSSVVWGMPGATVRLGAAHETLPLGDIPHRLVTLAGLRDVSDRSTTTQGQSRALLSRRDR